MPLSFYMTIIPGAIQLVSAVEGKVWLFHGVLVVEWTDGALCLTFVACRSVHIKASSRLIYGKIPILTTSALITALISCRLYVSISGWGIRIVTLCNDFHHTQVKMHPYHDLAPSWPDCWTGRTMPRCRRGQISNSVEIWILGLPQLEPLQILCTGCLASQTWLVFLREGGEDDTRKEISSSKSKNMTS